VIVALAAHVMICQTPQLAVNVRQQFVESRLVSVAPPDEQLSYVRRGCHWLPLSESREAWIALKKIHAG
jgi:hypothetical protein